MEDEFSSSSSDNSLESTYLKVNSITASMISEPVQLVKEEDADQSSMSSPVTAQSPEKLDPDLSIQSRQHPIRRNDSMCSTSSSIILACEDFTAVKNTDSLKQSLSNLDTGMLESMTTSFTVPALDKMSLASLTKSMGQSFTRKSSAQNIASAKNKKLEIQFSRSPDRKDLDRVKVFLENKRASGGGDILKTFEFDQSNSVWTIEFKSSLTKQRLLQNGSLSFRNYKLFVNDPIDKDALSPDRTVMILANVSDDEDLDVVQMFAENLVSSDASDEEESETDKEEFETDEDTEVLTRDKSSSSTPNVELSQEDNEIVDAYKSVIYQQTFLFKFKNAFDMKLARERLQQRNCLNGNPIELIDAYQTNIVLIRDSKCSLLKSKIDSIANYLTELYKSTSSPFSIRLMEPFLLVRCNRPGDMTLLMKKEHTIDNHTYFTDYLVNYELLLKEIQGIHKLSEKADHVETSQDPTGVTNSELEKTTSVAPLECKEPANTDRTAIVGPLVQDLQASASELTEVQADEQEDSGHLSTITDSTLSVELDDDSNMASVTGTVESTQAQEETKTAEHDTEMGKSFPLQVGRASIVMKPYRPCYDLDSNTDPRVKAIIYWEELYFSKFIHALSSLSPEVVLNRQKELFHIQCTYELPNETLDPQGWIDQAKSKIDQFLGDFEYFRLSASAAGGAECQALLEKISYEKEKVRTLYNVKLDVVEVYGLKAYVEEYVAELLVAIRQSKAQPAEKADQPPRTNEVSAPEAPSVTPPATPPLQPKAQESTDLDKPSQTSSNDNGDLAAENMDEFIKDGIRGLKINQVRVLYVYNFIRNVKERYNVQVSLSASHGILKLEGKRSEVNQVKQLAQNMVDKIETRVLDISEAERMTFLTKKEIAIVHWLREKNIKCALVPDLAKKTLSLNSLSERDIDTCIEAIMRDIVSVTIDCDLLNNLPEFEEFMNQLQNSQESAFVFTNNIRALRQVRLTGFKKQVDEVYRQIVERFVD